jgi:hypothetical protein
LEYVKHEYLDMTFYDLEFVHRIMEEMDGDMGTQN